MHVESSNSNGVSFREERTDNVDQQEIARCMRSGCSDVAAEPSSGTHPGVATPKDQATDEGSQSMAQARTACDVAERKSAGADQHAGGRAEADTPGHLDGEHLPQQRFEERGKDDSGEEFPPSAHPREMGCGRSAAHAFG